MSRDIYEQPMEGDRVKITPRGNASHQPPKVVIVSKVDERGVNFINEEKGSFSFASWEIWRCKDLKTCELLSGPIGLADQ